MDANEFERTLAAIAKRMAENDDSSVKVERRKTDTPGMYVADIPAAALTGDSVSVLMIDPRDPVKP